MSVLAPFRDWRLLGAQVKLLAFGASRVASPNLDSE